MRCFFDTNVLVYAWDAGEAAKRARARALIEEAIDQARFVVSTQVLLEFYASALRRRLLGPAQALELVAFWGTLDVVAHTPGLLARGLALHQAHSLSVWDGLIVQAALDARCELLLSEDLQHGRRFGELEVCNPFLAPAAHEPVGVRYRPSSPRKASGRLTP